MFRVKIPFVTVAYGLSNIGLSIPEVLQAITSCYKSGNTAAGGSARTPLKAQFRLAAYV